MELDIIRKIIWGDREKRGSPDKPFGGGGWRRQQLQRRAELRLSTEITKWIDTAGLPFMAMVAAVKAVKGFDEVKIHRIHFLSVLHHWSYLGFGQTGYSRHVVILWSVEGLRACENVKNCVSSSRFVARLTKRLVEGNLRLPVLKNGAPVQGHVSSRYGAIQESACAVGNVGGNRTEGTRGQPSRSGPLVTLRGVNSLRMFCDESMAWVIDATGCVVGCSGVCGVYAVDGC